MTGLLENFPPPVNREPSPLERDEDTLRNVLSQNVPDGLLSALRTIANIARRRGVVNLGTGSGWTTAQKLAMGQMYTALRDMMIALNNEATISLIQSDGTVLDDQPIPTLAELPAQPILE